MKGISADIGRSVDAALRLKQQEMERFFARRDIEWRVSLAVWASFAVVANAGRDLSPTPGQVALLFVGAGLFAAGHLWWLWTHSVRHETARVNRDRGVALDNAVRAHLGLPQTRLKPPLPYSKSAHLWPAGVTVVLALGAAFVIAVD
ncbi:MAG: hypothetical protein WD184_02840 [Acidimicrobiia bacterium]